MWAPCHDCYFDNNTVIRTHDFTSPLNGVVVLDFEGIHFRNNLFAYRRMCTGGRARRASLPRATGTSTSTDVSATHGDPNPAGSGDPGLVDLAAGDYHPPMRQPAGRARY